jgi:hypothetical protein
LPAEIIDAEAPVKKLIFGLVLLTSFSRTALAETEWTILVFINGHNDLSDAATVNLQQMEKVGSNDAVKVVVEWASLSKPDNTKRMLIQRSQDPSNVTSPVIEDLGRVNMGDANVLKDFFLWGIQNYPAKHYFAVVWDHGSGWHFVNSSLNTRFHARDISYDELFGSVITTEQLGQVMHDAATAAGRSIDIYGSDACEMAMGEVAAEMTGAVDYFAGSEETEPTEGWPYDIVLAKLAQNPAMSPADFSSMLSREYVKSFAGQDEVTFSIFDMAKLAGFESAISDLSASLAAMSATDRANLLSDVKTTQSFAGDYGDVGDLLSHLEKRGVVAPSLIQNAQSQLKNLVIENDVGDAYKNAHGISIWLPSSAETYAKYKDRYDSLNFSQHTGWRKAIDGYLN